METARVYWRSDPITLGAGGNHGALAIDTHGHETPDIGALVSLAEITA